LHSPATAYIALGANLGDRRKNLEDALAMLGATPDVRVTAVSSFLDNPAVGGPADSPPFLNAAAELETSLAPIDLLHRLLEIERRLGRVRREKWGPRKIDLDLLTYGEQIITTDELVLPHPRLGERRFVLQPLAQIAADLPIPGLDASVIELLRNEMRKG
jgi:2-amino-4-hydroxy-6-hydroxymethyldihydropteridine diphosphokinase